MKRIAAVVATLGLVIGLTAGPAFAGTPIKPKVNHVASGQVHLGH